VRDERIRIKREHARPRDQLTKTTHGFSVCNRRPTTQPQPESTAADRLNEQSPAANADAETAVAAALAGEREATAVRTVLTTGIRVLEKRRE
jgi:hypothetical protein